MTALMEMKETNEFTKWLKEKNKPKLCVVCEKKMTETSLGGGDVFSSFGIEQSAYYCKNKKCKHLGLLTLAFLQPIDKEKGGEL